MARKPAGAAKTVDDGRTEFTLDQHQTDSYHAASDAMPGEDGVDPMTAFWQRMGAAIGFDPETIVLIDVAGNAVRFKAAAAAIVVDPNDDAEDRTADQIENFHNGLDHMAGAAGEIDLDHGTMLGDITDTLVELIKRLPKPWDAHSQQEKRDLVAKLDEISREIVRASVDLIAADSRDSVKALVEKIAVGDKVMITLKLAAMPEEEISSAITALYQQHKKTVMIVTADADRHMGRRREPVAPDQEPLPFDAGKDPPAHPADDSDLSQAGGDEEEVEEEQ